MKKALTHISIFTLIIGMTSCATTSHDPSVRQARDGVLKTRTTYLQGAALGALGGAGAGAIIGNQTNNDRGAEIGAIIGGVGGAFAGLAYAQHVVQQRQYYQDAASYLTDCTRVAENRRSNVEKYNSTLSSRTASIRKDQQMIRGTIQDSNQVLAQLREETQRQETALAQARSEGVSSSLIRKHEKKISALKAEERRLVAQVENLSDYERQSSLTSSDGS